jgi:hypothetical protein
MDTFELIREILSGASDVALIAIAWAIWKIDRRVYRLEIKAKIIE